LTAFNGLLAEPGCIFRHPLGVARLSSGNPQSIRLRMHARKSHQYTTTEVSGGPGGLFHALGLRKGSQSRIFTP
jgi:hypothetical protein